MERNESVIVEETASHVSRVAVRVPPFWPEEPELWFAQFEGQFLLCGINQDATKYAYVISQIETKHAREIKDVITAPSQTGKYEAIKSALIKRLTDLQEQRIRQLLEREEIGDCRPSQFLRHLRTLAGTSVPDTLLRTLWMGRLPAQMQVILATRTDDRLDDIAEQADRIFEVTARTTEAACRATSSQAEQTQASLVEQIARLTKQLAALDSRLKKQETRARSRSRSRSRKSADNKDICLYHQRFKEQARKCTQPCKFVKKPEN